MTLTFQNILLAPVVSINRKAEKTTHGSSDSLNGCFRSKSAGKERSARPVIEPYNTQGQGEPPLRTIPLGRREVKQLKKVAHMRALIHVPVVDKLQHPNNLKYVLQRNEIRNKTTDQLLRYIKDMEDARAKFLSPGSGGNPLSSQSRQDYQRLRDLIKMPLYLVYQEMNFAIDTSSTRAFAWRFLTGQAAGHCFSRPLLQCIIPLLKANPGITLARMVAELTSTPAHSHNAHSHNDQSYNEAVRIWLQYLDNSITSEDADHVSTIEDGVGAEEICQGREAVGRGGWKRRIMEVAMKTLLLLSGTGAAAESTTPSGARGAALNATTPGLYLPFSPAPAGVSWPPTGLTNVPPVNGRLWLEQCGETYPGFNSGRPVRWLNNELAAPCGFFTDHNAEVICAEWGYTREGAWYSRLASGGKGCQYDDVATYVLQCNGREDSSDECKRKSYRREEGCDADVIVHCPLVRISQGNCTLGESTGPDAVTGRAEVWISDLNRYGSIDKNGFDNMDATIFCRGLSFSVGQVEDRPCPGKGPIARSNSQCSGDETTFLNCRFEEPVGNYSTHENDVVIKCSTSLRFARGNHCPPVKGGRISSSVEMYRNNRWGSVCDLFRYGAEKVGCGQLGYPREPAEFRNPVDGCQGVNPYIFEFVYCNGNEKRLQDCADPDAEKRDCTPDDALVLSCQNARMSTENSCIVDQQPGMLIGRPEIWLMEKQQFGTFCKHNFDENDATAFCRGFMYSAGEIVDQSCPGNGTIVRNSLLCRGNETSIQGCLSGALISGNCTHADDVVVRCSDAIQPDPGTVTDNTSPDPHSRNGRAIGAVPAVLGSLVVGGSAVGICLNARKLQKEKGFSGCHLMGRAVLVSLGNPLYFRGPYRLPADSMELMEDITETEDENADEMALVAGAEQMAMTQV